MNDNATLNRVWTAIRHGLMNRGCYPPQGFELHSEQGRAVAAEALNAFHDAIAGEVQQFRDAANPAEVRPLEPHHTHEFGLTAAQAAPGRTWGQLKHDARRNPDVPELGRVPVLEQCAICGAQRGLASNVCEACQEALARPAGTRETLTLDSMCKVSVGYGLPQDVMPPLVVVPPGDVAVERLEVRNMAGEVIGSAAVTGQAAGIYAMSDFRNHAGHPLGLVHGDTLAFSGPTVSLMDEAADTAANTTALAIRAWVDTKIVEMRGVWGPELDGANAGLRALQELREAMFGGRLP